MAYNLLVLHLDLDLLCFSILGVEAINPLLEPILQSGVDCVQAVVEFVQFCV